MVRSLSLSLARREVVVSILGQKCGLLGIFYAEIIGGIALFLPPAVFPFGGYLHDYGVFIEVLDIIVAV